MKLMEKNVNVWIWVCIIVAMLFLFGTGGYGMMGFGMGFGLIFMLLFWGALIWLIINLIKSSQSEREKDDSTAILKKRYAAGEISKKQYEEMKRELKDE